MQRTEQQSWSIRFLSLEEGWIVWMTSEWTTLIFLTDFLYSAWALTLGQVTFPLQFSAALVRAQKFEADILGVMGCPQSQVFTILVR